MANPSIPAPEGYIGPGVYEVKDVDIKPDRRAVSLMYDETSSVAKVRDLGDMIPYVKDEFLFPYNDSTWPKVLIIMYEDRNLHNCWWTRDMNLGVCTIFLKFVQRRWRKPTRILTNFLFG